MTKWTPDERRSRWERSVAAKEAAGFPIERDPQFLAWIEEWIFGRITMPEVQRRYADQFKRRQSYVDAHKNIETTQTMLEKIRLDVADIDGFTLTEVKEQD